MNKTKTSKNQVNKKHVQTRSVRSSLKFISWYLTPWKLNDNVQEFYDTSHSYLKMFRYIWYRS